MPYTFYKSLEEKESIEFNHFVEMHRNLYDLYNTYKEKYENAQRLKNLTFYAPFKEKVHILEQLQEKKKHLEHMGARIDVMVAQLQKKKNELLLFETLSKKHRKFIKSCIG